MLCAVVQLVFAGQADKTNKRKRVIEQPRITLTKYSLNILVARACVAEASGFGLSK